jgi:HK97 family phage prohead protease
MFIETFRSGAFDKCLDGNPDVYACVNHDPAKVLGRTLSKTLRITRAADGLEIEGDMPNTTYANDLREQLRRQDIRGMSFIFEAIKTNGGKWSTARTLRTRGRYTVRLSKLAFTK